MIIIMQCTIMHLHWSLRSHLRGIKPTFPRRQSTCKRILHATLNITCRIIEAKKHNVHYLFKLGVYHSYTWPRHTHNQFLLLWEIFFVTIQDFFMTFQRNGFFHDFPVFFFLMTLGILYKVNVHAGIDSI